MRGTGRVFRKPKTQFWWIAYPHQGREIRESSGSTDPRKAERLLNQRLKEVGAAQIGARPFIGPAQERVTLDDLLTDLKRDYEIRGRRSLPQLRAHLRPVEAYFGRDRALTITPPRLRDYIAHRQAQGAANATINRELEAIRRAFALAVEAGTLAVAPKVPRLSQQNARQGFFERGEFEAVLHRLDDPDVRDFVEWFWWTGMRPGEIRSLTWADFDRETSTLRLHASGAKTGHGRVIALEGQLRAIIDRRWRARVLSCPFVFHRGGRPMGEFRKAWKSACRAAGLTGKLLYDLRRTAVRNMVRAGVDPSVAMKISGHRTRSIFDRYNIVDQRDLREALEKTARYVESLPATTNVVPLHTAEARAG